MTSSRHNPASCLLLGLGLLLLPASAISLAQGAGEGAAPEKHAIKLSRPLKVGYKFREQTKATYMIRQVSRQAGVDEVQEERQHTIELDCHQIVEAVTPKGAPMAYLIRFDRLVRTDKGGKEEAIFEPGTRVQVRALKPEEMGPDEQESLFTVEGKPVDRQLNSELADLFGVSATDNQFDLDDIYGSEQPRAIGERWPINTARAMQWFNRGDVLGINGETTLVRRHVVDGTDCLQIGHTICARRSPGGVRMIGRRRTDSQSVYAMLANLPVDPKLMERGYESFKWVRHVVPSGEMDDSEIRIYQESHYETHLTPLPEDAEI